MTKRGVHIYRHTFAQKKISENVNMETLRQALGHSDIGITAAFYAANSEKNKSDAFSSSKNRR
jgi:integrase/recombinase XerD